MLYEDDHQEWVGQLVSGLNRSMLDDCIPTDNEVWEIAREHRKPPHIANIWMNCLFGRIHTYIEETYFGELDVEYYVNAMDSSLTVGGESITEAKDLLAVLKGADNTVVIFDDDTEDGIKIQIDVGNGVEVLLVSTGEKYEWFIEDEYANHSREKIDPDITEWGQEFLEFYDFSIYKNQYIAEHLAEVEAIMKVNEDKTIRYLMVGAVVDSQFFGSVSDYTGGGEYTEYFFEAGKMLEADYPDEVFEEAFPELSGRIGTFKAVNGISLDGIGNYIYTGEDFNADNLKFIGNNINPIGVGNTIFEEVVNEKN